jgi:tetratricopeptide (TPR) repeat protein
LPNPIRRWIDAAWPAALLLLFLATFRTGGRDAVPAAGISICDSPAALGAAALEQCLAVDPDNVGLITALGDAHGHRGDAAGAEALYRRALRLDARDGDVHLRLGELLLARGDAASARQQGSAALAVQPGSLAAARLIERAATLEGPR